MSHRYSSNSEENENSSLYYSSYSSLFGSSTTNNPLESNSLFDHNFIQQGSSTSTHNNNLSSSLSHFNFNDIIFNSPPRTTNSIQENIDIKRTPCSNIPPDFSMKDVPLHSFQGSASLFTPEAKVYNIFANTDERTFSYTTPNSEPHDVLLNAQFSTHSTPEINRSSFLGVTDQLKSPPIKFPIPSDNEPLEQNFSPTPSNFEFNKKDLKLKSNKSNSSSINNLRNSGYDQTNNFGTVPFNTSKSMTTSFTSNLDTINTSSSMSAITGSLTSSKQKLQSTTQVKELISEFRTRVAADPDNVEAIAADILRKNEHVNNYLKWKFHLEISEFAKKQNLISLARKHYYYATKCDKKTANIWLEWSKMEEENGRAYQALQVLVCGLQACKLNDTLFPRFIKLPERLHLHDELRHIFSLLSNNTNYYASISSEDILSSSNTLPDRNWKLIFEAALFEARVGRVDVARLVLEHLMQSVSWYGPLYYEAFRIEEREGEDKEAFNIIERGLKDLPRYGPLWFGLLRIMEREDMARERALWQEGGISDINSVKSIQKENPLRRINLSKDLTHVVEDNSEFEDTFQFPSYLPQLSQFSYHCEEAVKNISKELTWRIYFEKFQAEERSGGISALGRYYRLPSYKILKNECSKDNSVVLTFKKNEKEQSTTTKLLSPQVIHSLIQDINGTLDSLGLQETRDIMLEKSRISLTKSLLLCPPNLRWKLFIVGARLELYIGRIDVARKLLGKSFSEVPTKSKASVYIECSRLEEYIYNISRAKKILNKAEKDLQYDWRIWLEKVLLSTRAGNINEALVLSRQATVCHPGTGRIWALYIQLFHRWEGGYILHKSNKNEKFSNKKKGINMISHLPPNHEHLNKILIDNPSLSPKDIIIRQAVAEVPKSGEVWCEYGRCCLNPLLLDDFNLRFAQQSLAFAIQFTPQYGDTFVEYIRLEMICQRILQPLCHTFNIDYNQFVLKYLNLDPDSDLINQCLNKENNQQINLTHNRVDMIKQILSLTLDTKSYTPRLKTHSLSVTIPNLHKRCVNADPNYGSLWFHCRHLPYDIPGCVLVNAERSLQHELTSSIELYIRAVFIFMMKCFHESCSKPNQDNVDNCLLDVDGTISDLLDDYLEAFKSLYRTEDSFQDNNTLPIPSNPSTIITELNGGRWFTVPDFTTGMIEMNRIVMNPHNPDELRRKYLFGIHTSSSYSL